MREKINIFNSVGTEPQKEPLTAFDDKSEIKTGLVSEIIASFSTVDAERTKKNQVWEKLFGLSRQRICFPNINISQIFWPIAYHRYQDSAKLEIPDAFKEQPKKKETLCSDTALEFPGGRSRQEKEKVYKEFERYDEKYSQFKTETRSAKQVTTFSFSGPSAEYDPWSCHWVRHNLRCWGGWTSDTLWNHQPPLFKGPTNRVSFSRTLKIPDISI